MLLVSNHNLWHVCDISYEENNIYETTRHRSSHQLTKAIGWSPKASAFHFLLWVTFSSHLIIFMVTFNNVVGYNPGAEGVNVIWLLLTHWGRVTHICISKLTTTGSGNGLPPGRHQAIIWTSAGILWIGPLVTNFSENLIGIQTFSFKKMPLKMSSAKCRPFCLGLNVLKHNSLEISTCIYSEHDLNISHLIFP